MVDLQYCPLCKHEKFSKYLDCKDYFLSQEDYPIDRCDNCGLLFTNPIPLEKDLPDYYKSEEYISHTNVKGGLINTLYHRVRSYAVKQKYNLVKNHSAGNRILDIGCGTGEFLNHFRARGWQTTGIEPDPRARQQAEQRYKLEITDIESLAANSSSRFDVITMWHVLEHVYDLHTYINKIKRILHENGTFIVAVPNSESWDAKHYKKFWAAYDVPRHLYHFSKSSMKELMDRHHLELKKILPMKFDAYYVCLLSEKYKRGKQTIIRGFFNGFYSNTHAFLHKGNYSSCIFIFKNG